MSQMTLGFDLGPSILTMPYILKNYSNIAKEANVRLRYNQAMPHQWRSFFQMERLSICMKVLKKQVSIMRYRRNRI